MDSQIINEEVQGLFEESNQRNIYYIAYEFAQCLETLKPRNLNFQTSVQIMIDLINSIVYLKTNKLNPAQIKFSYVGRDQENNWGLKHAICYRSIQSSKGENSYDPTQFHYHEDQDNELVWSLGKIWLRFYTDRKVNIIDTTQSQIDEIVDKSVKDSKINKIIKRMLTAKKDKRISFQKFIDQQVFEVKNFQKNLYSSIFLHFNNVSKNYKIKNSLNKRQIKTPYEEQVFRRDMEESLDICNLLQKVSKMISSLYQKTADTQFSIFIIKAEAYCILKKIDEKKSHNQIIDYSTSQKKFYSKFVTRMLTLKQQLERKMKMKIFYEEDGLNDKQKQFIIPTDEMTLPKIHNIFKNILVEYYMESVKELKIVAEKSMNQEKISQLQKRSLIFLLGRLCNQIFTELRSYIFEEFIKRQSEKESKQANGLNIEQLLLSIEDSKDPIYLRLIRKRVYENGLSVNTDSKKQIKEPNK